MWVCACGWKPIFVIFICEITWKLKPFSGFPIYSFWVRGNNVPASTSATVALAIIATSRSTSIPGTSYCSWFSSMEEGRKKDLKKSLFFLKTLVIPPY